MQVAKESKEEKVEEKKPEPKKEAAPKKEAPKKKKDVSIFFCVYIPLFSNIYYDDLFLPVIPVRSTQC
jgi:hypothetical protein